MENSNTVFEATYKDKFWVNTNNFSDDTESIFNGNSSENVSIDTESIVDENSLVISNQGTSDSEQRWRQLNWATRTQNVGQETNMSNDNDVKSNLWHTVDNLSLGVVCWAWVWIIHLLKT